MADYNMNYSLDDDLKETPEDPDSMAEGFSSLLEAIENEEDDVKKATLGAKAAIFAQILGLLEDSENLFTEAIKTFKSYDLSKQATELRTRLAVTHLYMGKEDEANKIFDQIIEKSLIKPKDEALAKLKGISLMAQGKHKFWNNQLPGALRCIKEAAEIKLNLGDTAGHSQCNSAIKLIEAKKKEVMGTTDVSDEAHESFIDPLLDLDGTVEDED